MDDAFGHEDPVAAPERLSDNGEYLCVEGHGEPRQIYRRLAAGARPHPLVGYRRHGGQLYSLAWVEDEREDPR
jgi:hypothetical protein